MANKVRSMGFSELEQISAFRTFLETNKKRINLQILFIYMFTWIPGFFIPMSQNPQLHSITHFLINWIVAFIYVFLGMRIKKKSKEYVQLSRDKKANDDLASLLTQHIVYFAVAMASVAFSFYYLRNIIWI